MIKKLDLGLLVTNDEGNELPVPEKPVIDDKSPRDVVMYKDKMFEVPSDLIHYLADHPDNLPSRVRRTRENGMMLMHPGGGFHCGGCSFYPNGAKTLKPGQVGIYNYVGTPGIEVKGCKYKQGDVRWASEFTNRETGEDVMAERTPCVVNDSIIAELAEKGLLNKYEVHGKEFGFPKIIEMVKSHHEQRSKPKGLVAKIKNFFRRKQKGKE